MEIKNNVIWVTGGCSGIGLASTKAYLAKGAKVLVTDLNADAGSELEKEYEGSLLFRKADIQNTNELKAALQAAMEKWGKLNALLACAGGSHATWLIPMAPTVESFIDEDDKLDWQYSGDEPGSLEDFTADVMLNLVGNFDVARLAAWEMMKNEPNEYGERGSIIFISSNAAKRRHSPGFNCGYSSAKAGLLGLAKEMAVNLAPAGIRVNNILPAYIETPLTINDMIPEVVQKDLLSHRFGSQIFPIDRGGKPENIASMAVELVENWFINNAVMEVTGGAVSSGSYQR